MVLFFFLKQRLVKIKKKLTLIVYFMNFLPVWERIKEKTELKKFVQLADFLEISQQYVTKRKKENYFPEEWAFRIGQHFKISTDWLLTGEKEKHTPKLNFLIELETWAKESSGGDNIQWLENQIHAAFPMFVEWKKRKEEQKSKTDSTPEKKIA